ncbi:MAG: TIGR03086 family metal-binding protein [Candidatus Dormibacteraceae bacterium]
MTTDAKGPLALAGAAAGAMIDGVRDDQWSAPTPCEGWTVADLVQHLVQGNLGFVRALGGAVETASTPDRRAAFHASLAALLEAFGRPGVLEETVTVPFGSVPGAAALHLRVTELLVHAWDLARATGQTLDVSPELAEQELSFSRAKLLQLPPDRSPFGPPQPIAEDAPAMDRLAALLGRRP